MLSLVRPTPVDIEMEFPPAELHSSYTGICTATSDPIPPNIQITLDNEDCHYITEPEIVDTDRHTRIATLTIKPVTRACQGAIVKCQANNAQKIKRLDVTEEIYVTTPIPSEGT